ncbi:uncharacterized protein LOC109723793 isoform X2 [Ananas comosus]|uniref:Uncharacterized protein LOC109723793 isoform X2 n=1 Tax=Ananas comosus TaxID=4615 RepID=A0A6P5GQZ5_ANACO|nr:uncharacterized protein LOC109723793 isoform X2 [Ananas comosus]
MVGQVHACHLRTIPILQELTRRGWSTVQSLARSEQISASRGVALKCNGYSSRQAGGSHISSPRPPRATRSSEQLASERASDSDFQRASEREREAEKEGEESYYHRCLESGCSKVKLETIMRRREVGNSESHPIVDQEHTKPLDNHQYRHRRRSGDITWIKISDHSWWPSQVVDEESVANKPKKKAKDEVLVRIYGTCKYFYVDPLKFISEFESVRKRENISTRELLKKTLEQDISKMKSAGKSKRKLREPKDNDAAKASNHKKQKQDSRGGNQEETVSASPVITSGKSEAKKVYTRSEALRQREAKLEVTRESTKMENAKPEPRKENIMNQCTRREQNATKLSRKASVKNISGQDGLRRSSRINAKEQTSERVASETSPPGDAGGRQDKMGKANETKKAQNGMAGHNNQKRVGFGHPESEVSEEEIRAMVRDVIFRERTSKQSVNGKPNAKEEIGNGASEVGNAKGEGFGKKEREHAEKQVNIVSSAETLTGLVRKEGPEVGTVKKDSFRKQKIEDAEDRVTKKIVAKTSREKEVKQLDTEEKESNNATNCTLRTKMFDKDNSTTLKPNEIKEQETAKGRDKASKHESRRQGNAGIPTVTEDVGEACKAKKIGKVDPNKSKQLDFNGQVVENGSCRASKYKGSGEKETRKQGEAKSGACQGKPFNQNDSKQKENSNIKMHQSTVTTTPQKRW